MKNGINITHKNIFSDCHIAVSQMDDRTGGNDHGFDFHSGGINYYLLIFTFSCFGNNAGAAFNSTIYHTMSHESGEQNPLTLGSLCQL